MIGASFFSVSYQKRGRSLWGKAPTGGPRLGAAIIWHAIPFDTQAFPRMRESTPQTIGNALSTD
jgi:hypothetical protein